MTPIWHQAPSVTTLGSRGNEFDPVFVEKLVIRRPDLAYFHPPTSLHRLFNYFFKVKVQSTIPTSYQYLFASHVYTENFASLHE